MFETDTVGEPVTDTVEQGLTVRETDGVADKDDEVLTLTITLDDTLGLLDGPKERLGFSVAEGEPLYEVPKLVLGADDCDTSAEADTDRDELSTADTDTLDEITALADGPKETLDEVDTVALGISVSEDDRVARFVLDSFTDEEIIEVIDTVAVIDTVTVNDAVLVSEGVSARADGVEVTVNDASLLAETTLGDADVDAEGEDETNIELLSRLLIDVEDVAEVENSALCEDRTLEESDAESRAD